MDLPVFSLAYLPNIQYFTEIIKFNNVLIEQHDNYSKQTYRNRCEIYGANGKQTLSVPIIKFHNKKTKLKDIKIDYATNWQKNHWKSIESAYNSSPFFEYYLDFFNDYYLKKETFLIDYNLKLFNTIISLLKLNIQIHKTNTYILKGYQFDFRELCNAKGEIKKVKYTEYNQVFQSKHGFIQNLSVIDLLFNEGPNSMNILKD